MERCEPRVISLEESANQLLDANNETRRRLQKIKVRLQSLRRITGVYALKLGSALGLDPREIGLAATSSMLASLSQDVSKKSLEFYININCFIFLFSQIDK